MLAILESPYCKLIFALALLAALLLIPREAFVGIFLPMAVLFMLAFAANLTCIVRNIKEKILVERSYGASVVSIIASLLGAGALHICSAAASTCGGAIALWIISLIIPGVAFFIEENSIIIIAVALAIQLVSLYFLKCFKKYNSIKK